MKGQKVGYVRVSSVEQNTGRQLEGIEVDRIFVDRASGKNTDPVHPTFAPHDSLSPRHTLLLQIKRKKTVA